MNTGAGAARRFPQGHRTGTDGPSRTARRQPSLRASRARSWYVMLFLVFRSQDVDFVVFFFLVPTFLWAEGHGPAHPRSPPATVHERRCQAAADGPDLQLPPAVIRQAHLSPRAINQRPRMVPFVPSVTAMFRQLSRTSPPGHGERPCAAPGDSGETSTPGQAKAERERLATGAAATDATGRQQSNRPDFVANARLAWQNADQACRAGSPHRGPSTQASGRIQSAQSGEGSQTNQGAASLTASMARLTVSADAQRANRPTTACTAADFDL